MCYIRILYIYIYVNIQLYAHIHVDAFLRVYPKMHTCTKIVMSLIHAYIHLNACRVNRENWVCLGSRQLRVGKKL